MIVTVTMNPAIDKTVEVSSLVRGGLNRIQHVEYDAGGKGINVSRTIQELGKKSVATGFLGGNNGRTIEEALKKKGIETDFVWIGQETRTNTKIAEENGEVTELNEPGPETDGKSLEELMEKLESLSGEKTLFVFSGSVPGGVDKDVYGQMIRRVHKYGSAVLLDADGEPFKRALDAGPDIIKPNRAELEEYAGTKNGISNEKLAEIAGEMKKKAGKIAVSMGADGAFFLLGESGARSPALPVEVRSTVGAGDAMVAALACAWEEEMEEEATIRLCMAASAGAVTTVGTKPPSKELVQSLAKQVMIERI